MAITTAQRNAGYRTLGQLLASTYGKPAVIRLFRLIVNQVKGGTTQQKEIGKVVAQELFEAAKGLSAGQAVGNHEYRHWVYEAIQNANGGDAFSLALGDAFDAENITVT